jgi:glycosyltransferase involved in cell wall biosynthesis
MLIGGSSPDTPDARQYYQKLESQVREMNLGEWIILKPNLPHRVIPDLYRLSDIFTCPSLWSEPSPISVVEALASGIPVVASETGGLPDRVRDGIDGFIVKANDATALGNRIAQILSDVKLKRELSTNARIEAQKNYSLQQFTSRHIVLYESLF